MGVPSAVLALGNSNQLSKRDKVDPEPLPDLVAVNMLPLGTVWLEMSRENSRLDPVLSQ